MSELDGAIAVVGMAGRWPGANEPARLWANLAAGERTIASTVEGVTDWDAEFFGISEEEARIIDPQHRLLLECAWEAMESAGHPPGTDSGVTSVFAGCSFPSYLVNNLATDPEVLAAHDELELVLANERDALTSRLAYQLDLRGPSVTVQTFSSTSLVAVHLACQSLLTEESDFALAGAAAIRVPLEPRPGICRSFDAAADGRVIGDGVAVVALKRLADAVADGDHVWCVIRGTAVNNAGSARPGYAAPGMAAQAEVMIEALAAAELSAEDVSYVEAHATGTPQGDAVELGALERAYCPREDTLLLGSCTANLGHLEGASGVTGLIKVASMLHNAFLPPQIDFDTPSPALVAAPSLRVNTEATKWTRGDGPLRAGVSSVGLGGVNAHVVLEEPPQRPVRSAEELAGPHLILLSAKTPAALEEAAVRLRDHLVAEPEVELCDVAYTLQIGRNAFKCRRALLCTDRAHAIELLTTPGPAPDVAESWLAGEAVDWRASHDGRTRLRVPLPTYPFQRRQCWVGPTEER
ncbi:hypothetical protein NLX83_39175 [Allokutzneria sp. A3M-2-11 16]|uniref:beta-ketoacyl synthase N-terminal-like domain-containing protein n=1 Tax=Allokutzneria sp. A3M-2-11 16 TaxID=2962043 RepID=UPI0020B7C9A4|nr:beta-ketoacyl synthase N-terminal-like domain-containing protein [Allokutzneria sp. A3M-2-11 16]MCP3805306.1 hypothetical protein [Allokutzneria sp. A3M-2-11 16]